MIEEIKKKDGIEANKQTGKLQKEASDSAGSLESSQSSLTQDDGGLGEGGLQEKTIFESLAESTSL